ncbi:MAG: hypothetical protein H7269_06285 [Cellulomonas sp.]|nr:hypothetical protein [Cellulomonas sp.]
MALPPGHPTRWRGVPVTSLDRTVADCLTGFGPLEGLLIADSALRLAADLDSITARIEARAGGLGRPAPHDGGSAAPERAR